MRTFGKLLAKSVIVIGDKYVIIWNILKGRGGQGYAPNLGFMIIMHLLSYPEICIMGISGNTPNNLDKKIAN